MASNQQTLPTVSDSDETLLSGVNENIYEDQSIGAELTKKDINRVAWRSMLLQASFNYERMQASGWHAYEYKRANVNDALPTV